MPDLRAVGRLLSPGSRRGCITDRAQATDLTIRSSLVLLVGGYIAEAVLDKQSFYSLGLTAEELLEDHLDEAIDRLFAVGTFFEYVADILIQICVVELGLGFLYCLQQNRTSLHHILRPCIFIVSFILFVLAIASMGLFNAEYTKEFNYLYALDSSDGSDFGPSVEFDRAAYENGLKAATNLGVAFDVIIFVASVLLVGFSAHVLHKCQQYPALRSVSRSRRFPGSTPTVYYTFSIHTGSLY